MTNNLGIWNRVWNWKIRQGTVAMLPCSRNVWQKALTIVSIDAFGS